MTVHEWPCNARDLVRRLGMDDNKHNVEAVVRPILTRLNCPQVGGPRSEFIVTPEIALLVANELGRGVQV